MHFCLRHDNTLYSLFIGRGVLPLANRVFSLSGFTFENVRALIALIQREKYIK